MSTHCIPLKSMQSGHVPFHSTLIKKNCKQDLQDWNVVFSIIFYERLLILGLQNNKEA